MWVRPMFRLRQRYGAYQLLMAELHSSDEEKYRGFVRFKPMEFDELLKIVHEDIERHTRGRLPIPADTTLAITLRYLATGLCNVIIAEILQCAKQCNN